MVTLAVAELFDVSESGTVELADAVLLITVPSVAEPLTLTVKRIASAAFTASCENVTVTLLPLPPQTPLPVAAHLVNDIPAGRLSVTVTVAGIGPLFFTISEKVDVPPGAIRF